MLQAERTHLEAPVNPIHISIHVPQSQAPSLTLIQFHGFGCG